MIAYACMLQMLTELSDKGIFFPCFNKLFPEVFLSSDKLVHDSVELFQIWMLNWIILEIL